ncbi:hypothetical protein HWV62_14098 [Athelia sp. TMB]|nr:hypothetical protein HWV62_14098 [Athelia sp. TMB]
MAAQHKYKELSESITKGLDNMEKCSLLNSIFPLLDNDLVLDPNIKDAYAKSKWAPNFFKKGMKSLQALFNKYKHEPLADVPAPINTPPLILSLRQIGTYGYIYMRDAVKLSLASEAFSAIQNPCQELDDYLSSGPVGVEDIVTWWGDYLAIQGSAVSSERAFSSSGITTTAHRNRLLPETIEALRLLTSEYHKGHISAATEAACVALRAQALATIQ